jgi:hypothetical protein
MVEGTPTELVNPGVLDVNNDVVAAPAGWIGNTAIDAAVKPTTKTAAIPETATARIPLMWACQAEEPLFNIAAPLDQSTAIPAPELSMEATPCRNRGEMHGLVCWAKNAGGF